eukprot:CAMPEP_0171171468 /NCGR_PEP_ID=MMETSP0790-20130122/9232_1 /TAXON_ID=2925 /ORGANISM="Alexandrium catenella, Strain OF101" /LENGTH=192 /DNA_ID=CAMNT_0011636321 /DNA_START=88 /DNA_END=663 /DNA_ORIENTATION=-
MPRAASGLLHGEDNILLRRVNLGDANPDVGAERDRVDEPIGHVLDPQEAHKGLGLAGEHDPDADTAKVYAVDLSLEPLVGREGLQCAQVHVAVRVAPLPELTRPLGGSLEAARPQGDPDLAVRYVQDPALDRGVYRELLHGHPLPKLLRLDQCIDPAADGDEGAKGHVPLYGALHLLPNLERLDGRGRARGR